MSNENSININKFISSTGVCSRRKAEEFINSGRVTINGNIAVLGNRVFENDEVKLDGKSLQSKPKQVFIALYKPIGIVSSTNPNERNNIVDFVGHPERLFPIGRLDKPSEGLIFLTNNGDIVNKILRAGNNHEKEYIVAVDKGITDDFIHRMANGIPILGTVTKKCKVEKISDKVFKIILVQGLNRQIRRMCSYLGYEVTKLKRTRIMNIKLGRLKVGEWRDLTQSELDEINKLIKTSSKTEEASKVVTPKRKFSTKKNPPKNMRFKPRKK